MRGQQVRRLITAFVTMDSIPLEPHFRQARQTGAIELTEYDEGMFLFGLYAAAHRLPFLPTPVGLGSDVLKVNPELKTIRSPYEDATELVAVPALKMDVALVHMNRADARGNAQYLGPDPYMDDLFAKAADRTYVSCERLVDTADFAKEGPVQSMLISRSHVVRRGRDAERGALHRLRARLRAGREVPEALRAVGGRPEKWAEFTERFLSGDEAAYQDAVRVWREENR